MPSVMVLSGVLVTGVNTAREFPHSFYHVRAKEEGAICEPGSRLSPDTQSVSPIILDFQRPERSEIHVCCLQASQNRLAPPGRGDPGRDPHPASPSVNI